MGDAQGASAWRMGLRCHVSAGGCGDSVGSAMRWVAHANRMSWPLRLPEPGRLRSTSLHAVLQISVSQPAAALPRLKTRLHLPRAGDQRPPDGWQLDRIRPGHGRILRVRLIYRRTDAPQRSSTGQDSSYPCAEEVLFSPCLFVCLFVRNIRPTRKTTQPIFRKFDGMWHMGYGRVHRMWVVIRINPDHVVLG